MQKTELQEKLCFKYETLANLEKMTEAITTRKEEIDNEFIESVKKLGVVTPIVVKNGKIIEGNRVIQALKKIYPKPLEKAKVKVPVIELCGVEEPPEFLRLISQLYTKKVKDPVECEKEILMTIAKEPYKDIVVDEICPICEAIIFVYTMADKKELLEKQYKKCIEIYGRIVMTQRKEVIDKNIARLKLKGIKEVPEIEALLVKRETKEKMIIPEAAVETSEKRPVEIKPLPTEEKMPEELFKFAEVVREVERDKERYEKIAENKGRLYAMLTDIGVPKQLVLYLLDRYSSEVIEEISYLSKEVPIEKLLSYLLPSDKTTKVDIRYEAYQQLKEMSRMFKIPTVYILDKLIKKTYVIANTVDIDEFDRLIESLKV